MMGNCFLKLHLVPFKKDQKKIRVSAHLEGIDATEDILRFLTNISQLGVALKEMLEGTFSYILEGYCPKVTEENAPELSLSVTVSPPSFDSEEEERRFYVSFGELRESVYKVAKCYFGAELTLINR